jgi:hypothetical protein
MQIDSLSEYDAAINQPFVDYLRDRIDRVRTADTKMKTLIAQEQAKKGIELFMV